MKPKSPFIQGFKDATLSKNSQMILSDVRGDGQGKLVIWSEQQKQLIVYKGCDRQYQKQIKLKHVNGIIQYLDEQSSSQPVIGMSSENGFYIFRGLAQSFRLRIPDIFAQPQQQLLWSEYENDPENLAKQLAKLDKKTLSENAKYFLGSNTIQRKRQIINKAFSEGISEKDAICAMTVIKKTDKLGFGNVVLGTELSRLYILDNYGHKFLDKKIINFAPSMLFAYGQYTSNFIIICIGRQPIIQIYGKADDPMQTLRLSSRVINAAFSDVDFATATYDQVITFYKTSNSNSKNILVRQNSFKILKPPLKLEFIKSRNYTNLIIAFQNEFRIYTMQKELIYTHNTEFKLYNILFGSFSRQEGCLILLYERNGFEVLILHRKFNGKDKFGTNKLKSAKNQEKQEDIPYPKKSNHFLAFWKGQVQDNRSYKIYQRSLRMLKWRTLKQKMEDKGGKEGQIQINSKILGLGPVFTVKISIENSSQAPLYNAKMMLIYPIDNLLIERPPDRVMMLAPFVVYEKDIEVQSVSKKNQQIKLQLYWNNNVVSSIIHIPNCEQIAS